MTYSKYDSIDVKVVRGDTETFSYSVTQNSAPVNFETYSITATGREQSDVTKSLFSIPILDSINGNQFNIGKIVLVMDKSVTAAMAESCKYDIQATSGNTTQTPIHGIMELLKDITS